MKGMRGLRGLLAAAVLLVAGCAGAPGEVPGSGSTPAPGEGATYGTFTTILQEGDGEPELCLGGVMESLPPQCGGPVVVGLDWEDVADRETASGTTWGTGWVVGTFDGETFTLTEPVASEAPEWAHPEEDDPAARFPPLCDDPYRGGDESFDASSSAGMDAVNTLVATAEGLDGYATLYVSDGSTEFNVIISAGHDAEAAHAALREVWPGWLCVVERDVPAQADATAAQDALVERMDELGVLGVGGGGSDGMLDVQVIVASDDVVASIHEAVSPWLTPEQVRISGVLQVVPD